MFDAVRHVTKLIEKCPDEVERNEAEDEHENDEENQQQLAEPTMKQKLNKLVLECGCVPFTANEFKVLEEYVSVMTPVANALDVLQGEKGKTITTGHLLPAIVVIRRTLNILIESGLLDHSEDLARAILEGIKKRFDDFYKDADILLAAAIHPKFKLDWLDETIEEESKLKESILANFKKRLLAQQEKEHCAIQPENLLSPEDQKDFFAPLKRRNLPNAKEPALIEIARFTEEKITENLNVLSSFPLIKNLFVSINTGLPSSAAVERLFSLGKRVLSPLRTLLSDNHFEMVVFLKANGPVVKKRTRINYQCSIRSISVSVYRYCNTWQYYHRYRDRRWKLLELL